ncbi:MAG TPA: sugar phosphate nucleotidyltransferase, partial [Thermoanaerobaculia bacterium]|nr:sugar phosphate nucleotidyltransferase [Thermoanaerobaculia bacterium]
VAAFNTVREMCPKAATAVAAVQSVSDSAPGVSPGFATRDYESSPPLAGGRHAPVVAVLCGGLGTRLGALAQGLPKPMIPIGGRPYLERVLESFAERGLRRFVLLTGYRSEVIEEHFGDGARFGIDITYSREAEPLGTGGALREARALLGERFVLTYGDVLRRFDYDRLVQEHEQQREQQHEQQHDRNCLAVYPRITIGNAELEGDLVIRFDKRAPELPYLDAGFSLMQSDTLDLLPQTGACSFEEIVYATLAAHRDLEAEIVDHAFFDIGTPEELERTRKALA